MKHLDPGRLHPHSIALLTSRGVVMDISVAGSADADALQAYFRGLSQRSRYNRMMGAISELPAGLLEAFTQQRDDGRFTLLATIDIDGVRHLIGEARYAFDPDTMKVELALSVADVWQGQGIGLALLSHLHSRANALGAEASFGDTLYSNHAMLALAKKAGFSFTRTPGDWKQVRFEKRIGRVQPSASWPMRADAAQHV